MSSLLHFLRSLKSMKMHRHIVNTWLVAILLYPAFLLLYFKLNGHSGLDWSQVLAGYLYYSWLGLAAGLPCLFLGNVCVSMIARTHDSIEAKFMLWLLIGPSIAFCGCLVMTSLLNVSSNERVIFCITVTLAAIISITLRLSRYQKFLASQFNIEV